MCGDGKKDALGGLRLAIEYKLVGLQQIAAGSLASDIFEYRHDLVHFAENPAVIGPPWRGTNFMEPNY